MEDSVALSGFRTTEGTPKGRKYEAKKSVTLSTAPERN